jgi:hypothetical protein
MVQTVTNLLGILRSKVPNCSIPDIEDQIGKILFPYPSDLPQILRSKPAKPSYTSMTQSKPEHFFELGRKNLVDLVLKIHAQSRVMATSNQFFS